MYARYFPPLYLLSYDFSDVLNKVQIFIIAFTGTPFGPSELNGGNRPIARSLQHRAPAKFIAPLSRLHCSRNTSLDIMKTFSVSLEIPLGGKITDSSRIQYTIGRFIFVKQSICVLFRSISAASCVTETC